MTKMLPKVIMMTEPTPLPTMPASEEKVIIMQAWISTNAPTRRKLRVLDI
mgnify:CR=1 FL=1